TGGPLLSCSTVICALGIPFTASRILSRYSTVGGPVRYWNSLNATETFPLFDSAWREGVLGSPAPIATFEIIDSTSGLPAITLFTRPSTILVTESVVA